MRIIIAPYNNAALHRPTTFPYLVLGVHETLATGLLGHLTFLPFPFRLFSFNVHVLL